MLSWQEDVLLVLRDYDVELIDSKRYCLVGFNTATLILNFVPLRNDYTPSEFITLQTQYRDQGITLMHVWEDVWYSRKKQVLGRIQSMLGLNKRVHARKTEIQRITQPQADAFLEANHLQSSARAKYKLALLQDEQMVAVACFSNLRLMEKKQGYRSAEVIRLASATGFTVIGGFSKLLKHFISEHQPNDIMSYADRDWSLGNAYEQAGFGLVAVTPPAEIYVDEVNFVRYFTHRIPEEGNFIKIFNTGNLKYILKV
jgi:hypothetical protein